MKWFHDDDDFLRRLVGQECSQEPASELYSEPRLHSKIMFYQDTSWCYISYEISSLVVVP
jgi:hypothetical protein